jgi:hypothetical protein
MGNKLHRKSGTRMPTKHLPGQPVNVDTLLALMSAPRADG